MTLAEFSSTAKRLRPRLTALATRICGADCADDAVQDTFLRLWDMRDRLDEYRSLDAFATVVCRNVSLDSVRARRPQTSLEDAADLAASRATAADAAIEAADAELMMERVMAMLSPGQRAVLELRHVEGLEIDEIARVTASTEAAVRVALCRARQRVKTLFLKHSSQ